MASPFAITKDEVSASLFVVTETWFDNYRALMSRVEKDALAGQPEKVALVSALSFVKDTSSLAKDHLPVKSVKAFLGSPKFGIPLFVIDFAAKAYEAHWKNLEARANAQKGAMYTTIFVDYLQKLTDIENRITSFAWYQSILDQAHGYLSKCEFSSPSGKNDGHIRTLVNLFLINLGVVPKTKDLYENMRNGFGHTIQKAKAIFECSHNQPQPLFRGAPVLPDFMPAIAFSATKKTVPVDAQEKFQSGFNFLDKYRRSGWKIVQSNASISTDEKKFQDNVLALAGMAEIKVIDYAIVTNPLLGGKTYEMKVCWVWKRQDAERMAFTKDSKPPQISQSEFSAALYTAAKELKNFGYDITIKLKPKP